MNKNADTVQLPSRHFTIEELLAILNRLPIDMTFVDRNDKVKYFSQSEEDLPAEQGHPEQGCEALPSACQRTHSG